MIPSEFDEKLRDMLGRVFDRVAAVIDACQDGRS